MEIEKYRKKIKKEGLFYCLECQPRFLSVKVRF